jgi:hypothetical protein
MLAQPGADAIQVGPQHFPPSVARLVMAVGANRDFNAIHYNTEAWQE